MGRRPHQEFVRLSARVPRGQAGYWTVIRALDEKGSWTVSEVHDETNEKFRQAVMDYVGRLLKGGFARFVGERRGAHQHPPFAKAYRLEKRPSLAPSLRRDGTLLPPPAIQRMWNAVRSLRHFTIDDVAFAGGSEKAIPKHTAERYIGRLVAAGYLQAIAEGGPGRRAVYRLKPAMNTGPLAPKILQLNVVWDDNRKEAVGADNAQIREVAS